MRTTPGHFEAMRAATSALVNYINMLRAEPDAQAIVADCYTFTLLTGLILTYTSADVPVTLNGYVFAAIQSRGWAEIQMLVWALTYVIFGVVPKGADIVYFSFVNYTTLGYGDVTPVERWHLLGPMTAMNGVLLFGWSTAVIFEVLRMTLLASGGKSEKHKDRW